MNKTKIEWCDYTWNPVTGCKHGCPYCYAERIAKRFCIYPANDDGKLHVADSINDIYSDNGASDIKDPFKWGFSPTFHKYRLDEPQKVKKPSRIFVVSMGDLFGEWVPDEWIEMVFEVCNRAPWHTFLFLTKNPKRYEQFAKAEYNKESGEYKSKIPANCLTGATVTNPDILAPDYLRLTDLHVAGHSSFISFEPLLSGFNEKHSLIFPSLKWVIIGAQTGPNAVKPKPEWVQSIINQCRAAWVPLFLKDNLGWHEEIKEFPEGMSHG